MKFERHPLRTALQTVLLSQKHILKKGKRQKAPNKWYIMEK
ncbi:hypothetical protein HM1_2482 [Heliomicrobium modesticaldum Ice1]|uniref:Uncharacterized protein n=1 Tax=Heliobacterium modesticaldum (strain ATCC 51547 / Ice1) TaxID=498761 RepID=B0TAI1_HELMI|nr:hypothetical protein HM1_2482 [Heliomicrobium modesticaldum Ice1]